MSKPRIRQKGPKPAGPVGAVYVAVAAYDGKLDTHLAARLLNEQVLLAAHGWVMGFDTCNGNAMVHTARNLLAASFLRETWGPEGHRRPYTDLLFIDADVTFEPGAILRILQHPVDVVCGAPPLKTEPEGYPLDWVRDGDSRWVMDKDTGLLEIAYGPAGFLRIRRTALQRMIDAGLAPEAVARNCYGEVLNRYPVFFYVALDGERDLGEDVYFFERWRSIGGQAWVDPALGFQHTGAKRWQGNLLRFLVNQAAEQAARDAELKMDRDAAEAIARAEREHAAKTPAADAAD